MSPIRAYLYRWLFPRIHDAARWAVATIERDENDEPPPAHHVEAGAAVLAFFVMHTLFGPIDVADLPTPKPGSIEGFTDESMRITASIAQLKYERGEIEAQLIEYHEGHAASHNRLAAFLNACLPLRAALDASDTGALITAAQAILDLACLTPVPPPRPVSHETTSIVEGEMPAVTYGPAASVSTDNPLAPVAPMVDPQLGKGGVLGGSFLAEPLPKGVEEAEQALSRVTAAITESDVREESSLASTAPAG